MRDGLLLACGLGLFAACRSGPETSLPQTAIAITSPKSGATEKAGNIIIRGEAGDSRTAASAVWIKSDDGPFIPASSTERSFAKWTAMVPILDSGLHTLTARAMDADGNVGEVSQPIQIVPPDPPSPPTPPAPSLPFNDDFEDLPIGANWVDGSVHGNWKCIYCGSGAVGIALDETRVLTLRSNAVTAPSQTIATLVMSTRSDFGDIDLTIKMKTVEQTRAGSTPNTWETAWLVWHYDTANGNQGYYATLKTNGFEIGKFRGQPPDNQEFLLTTSDPKVILNTWHSLRVRMVGGLIEAWVDGVYVGSASDSSSQWPVFTSGAIALYEEDAEAHFDDITITEP